MTDKVKHENNHLSIKEQLLETAERLFAEKGYDGVGIREITATAGVNVSMVSYYFGGKEGLYKAVLLGKVQLLKSELEGENIKQLTPREIIENYAAALMRIHKSSPYLVQIMHRELLSPHGVLQQLAGTVLASVLQILRQAMERGVADGNFKADLDIDKSILMLAGAINFYFMARPLHSLVLEQDDEFTDAYIKNAVEIFLRGISGAEQVK